MGLGKITKQYNQFLTSKGGVLKKIKDSGLQGLETRSTTQVKLGQTLVTILIRLRFILSLTQGHISYTN
jgi:hypothetical protein